MFPEHCVLSQPALPAEQRAASSASPTGRGWLWEAMGTADPVQGQGSSTSPALPHPWDSSGTVWKPSPPRRSESIEPSPSFLEILLNAWVFQPPVGGPAAEWQNGDCCLVKV